MGLEALLIKGRVGMGVSLVFVDGLERRALAFIHVALFEAWSVINGDATEGVIVAPS